MKEKVKLIIIKNDRMRKLEQIIENSNIGGLMTAEEIKNLLDELMPFIKDEHIDN